jgi:adenylyltransferase/sulfurtransferase
LLAGRLLVFDALTMQSQVIGLPFTSTVTIKNIAADVPTISVAELKAALRGGVYELVDVRTADEHSSFNIGGRSMPLEDLLAKKTLQNAQKPIIFYCQSGQRSAIAVRHVLQQTPGRTVLSLEGGVQAWQLDREHVYG